ncbi:MAG TPA: hypothetical protein VIV40_29185 [Kofleriaceae bacterium]
MRALAAILVSSLAACAAEEPATYGEGLGTPENPIPDDDLTYAVASRIDFTVDGTLPPQVVDTVAALRGFSQNPAHALLAGADQTAVQALKTSLGSTLSSNLEGWLNTEIDKVRIATKTLRQCATDIVSITETSLTRFYLDSLLSMTPEKSTHTLAHLNFKPLSVDIVVLIGGSASDVLTQHPSIAVAPAGALSLGDQKFGLAFGSYAWSGINLASTAVFGAGVQTTIAGGLNCAAVAKAVSLKCSSSSCVGHESELRAICEAGGAALVGQLQQHVAAFHLDVFRFVGGNAHLVDNNGDGLADRILDGAWDVEMNLGAGLRKATATFTAAR